MVLSDKDSVGWKLLVTCWALMECLLFGGLFFGWGSLNFVLKSEGIYADLCPQDPSVNGTQSHTANETSTEARETSVKCKAQESRMALCFTIASALFPIGCVVFGHVIYKCGTRSARLIALLTKHYPYHSNAVHSLSGIVPKEHLHQVSNLFANGRSSVIGLLTGAFDTSSATMLLLKIASENGFTRQRMFLLITAAHSLVLVSTVFFLPKHFIMRQGTRSMTHVVGEDVEVSGQLELKEEAKSNTKISVTTKPHLSNCVCKPMFLTHIVWLSLMQLRFLYFIGTLNPFLERSLDGDESKALSACVIHCVRAWVKHLSAEYNLYHISLIYHIGCVCEDILYVHPGMKEYSLPLSGQYYPDEMCIYSLGMAEYCFQVAVALTFYLNYVSYFTNACYLIMTGGLVTSFFSGSVHDWQKRMLKDGKSKRYRTVAPAAVPIGIASLLSITMSVLVLIPNPSLLYITFIVMTVKRSFLFSIAAAFVSEVFPEEYFGVMMGLMQICAGIIGFFQFALFSWAEAYQGGAMHVDIFLLIMVCVTFLHPVYLWISSWKEERQFKGK